MSHYAKVLDGVVIQVINAEAEFFDTFIDTSPGEWIQTSYNTHGGVHYQPNVIPLTPSEDQTKALRKNYAVIGGTYDVNKDAFIPPKPFKKWVLNNDTCLWEPPVEMPTPSGDEMYYWDDDAGEWKLNT